MALIVDPDSLTQGVLVTPTDATWGAPTGQNTTISSGGSELPAINSGEYFEVRDHVSAANNGCYEATGSPSAAAIPCTKLGPTAPILDASPRTVRTFGTSTTPKNVMFDTASKLIYLFKDGVLSVDGVTMLAFHSFAKEEWKNDPDLIANPFPMIGIDFDAGKWEFGVDPSGNGNGWKLDDDSNPPTAILSRQLIRNGGWFERDLNNNIIRKYFNVTTLGTFEDVLDQAYYAFGNQPALDSSVDYDFAGPVNEPVKFFEEFGNPDTMDFASTSTITRATGSFITDGYLIGGQVTIRAATTGGNDGSFVLTDVAALTLTVTGTPFTVEVDPLAQISVDNSNAFKTFLRIRDADPEGKLFAQADLLSAGETSLVNKVIKFPLGNATDLKITASDATVDGSSPWTEIHLRYMDAVYQRDVDTPATPRDFGIVIDVGTFSDGTGTTAVSTTFLGVGQWASFNGALTPADFNGGTLRIHEGADAGDHVISGTPTDATGDISVIVTIALTAAVSNISYSLIPATPIVATAEQIYEKINRQLRRTTDIDEEDGTIVIGRTADSLLTFVGDALTAGSLTSPPVNPNGGGSGVIIEGFDANDTNRLTFIDNGPASRTFPFVAAGNLNFNVNLVTDASGTYWMYYEYTERFTNTGFGISSVTGPAGTLDSSTTDLTAELTLNDYVLFSGFTNDENNGLFQVTGTPAGAGPWTAAVTRVDGATIIVEAAAATVSVDKNPIDSPDAILVDNNSGADITGAIASTPIAFDFDYDNNVQGGRTAATDANIVLRAIGLIDAQFVETTGIITRATGLTFSLVSSLERNYSNP
jgi:hypothetical protein